jgi:hypothetical protein
MVEKIPVTKISQIKSNVLTLGGYRNFDKGSAERQFHDEIIARGQNFVVLVENGKALFAPSRFAGYQRNKIETHGPENRGGGGETNSAIDNVLGEHKANEDLEESYLKYCMQFHIKPKKAHKRPRKYWIIGRTADSKNDTTTLEEDLKQIRDDNSIPRTQREQLILARIGQGDFRKALLERWDKKCAVTLCPQAEVLRASHMKKWSDSSHSERLAPQNGLMLSANLDALFEVGLISFADEGRMLVSRVVKQSTMQSLGITGGMRLQKKLSNEEKIFLKYHREERFKKRA